MRSLPLAALLLAACSPDNSADFAGIYGSGSRDRLCLKKEGEDFRVGVIAYGNGNTNCSFRGTGTYIEGTVGELLSIHPAGDSQCEYYVELFQPELTLRPNGPACDYYCGPGASLEHKSFKRLDKREPVTDFAGDPLC